MHYTKVIAVVMTTVGLMAPAVAGAPVSDVGLITRHQDPSQGGPHQYCEPINGCAGADRRHDFINVDTEPYGATAGAEMKDHIICCNPTQPDSCEVIEGDTCPADTIDWDSVNADSTVSPNTADLKEKREWKPHCCDPLIYDPSCPSIPKWCPSDSIKGSPLSTAEMDGSEDSAYSKRQHSISGSPLSNPPADDPLNYDPGLWGDQGGAVNKKRDDAPDDCNPKSECGGPMGMRPGGNPAP